MKDGIAKVKSEIKGVMGVMQDNISKVLDRGAKLEDLQDKSGTYNNAKLITIVILYMLLLQSSNHDRIFNVALMESL